MFKISHKTCFKVVQQWLFFPKRYYFQKIHSPWILVIFTQNLDGRYSKHHRTEKIYFQKICAGGRRTFEFFRENSHGQTKSLYLIKTSFLILTKVFNEEQLMLWNICRMETEIEITDFSKSANIWKNSCFGGFFHFTWNKKISIIWIFLKLCVMLPEVIVFSMICVICPKKLVILQTGTIS